MSCQLSVLAYFQDIKSSRKYLFPESSDNLNDDEVEGWDDSDWGWKVEPEITDDDSLHDSHAWLQECHLSLSPAAEVMALAYQDRLVLLEQKYTSADEDVQMKYSLMYEGNVRQEESENVTCVLCLPLASQKRSTQGGPDWTCVILGFSSGYVRMYTENGTLLLSQIFSEEPVVNIKCKTYEPPRHPAEAEKHEELNIMYKKSVVSIDGFSLFQSLRGCRNQVARAAASGSEWMQPPPLAYKKWALQDQEMVTDQISCGTLTPNPFDQLLCASMVGGFTGSIRSTPPASHLYLTTGRTPYTGFYYIVEGSTQPMLSDVAHAVASKLKSALFSQISAASGWFGIGGKQAQENGKEKKRPKIEPATSVNSRYGLHDKRRQGESIVLSPDNKLAATTDSFGRVILIDIMQGIAVRIWKGYRDAQVGWVEVKEDSPSERGQQERKHQRRAIFLVIYAPRRGILEVWTAQQGSRVAAFNVSKWCRLLCLSYGMMGLNNVTYRDIKVQCHQIYLIDPEGTVKTIDVPFHLALSDRNSKRARDMHLLKKLKLLLKENDNTSSALQSDVINTLLDIKIASIRHQGLERVLLCKYLSVGFLDTVVKAVMQQIECQANLENVNDEIDALDYESKVLLHFCKAEEHLLHTYSSLTSASSEDLNQEKGELANLKEKLCKVLSISPGEIVVMKQELENYANTMQEKPHVKFESDFSMSVVEFLSCFECERQKDDKTSSGISVHVYAGLNENKKTKLANFLFNCPLETGTSSQYNLLLKESHILPDDLMSLLLHIWLSEENRDLSTVENLYTLVKSISCLKNGHEISSGYNEVSSWWQKMRDSLTDTQNLSSALLLALVSRSVAIELGKASMAEDMLTDSTDSNGKESINEWESVTMEKTQWSVLVKQLEDLLVLQCLLKMRPVEDGLINKTAWETDSVSVTVKKVIDGGRGKLPEFIAKWISGNGIPPSMLCLSQEATSGPSRQNSMCDTPEEGKECKEHSDSATENPIVAQLQAVQTRLPYSLDSDILMANCTWEYMVVWNKDPEVILPLELAISYLKCIQNGVLQHGVSVMMWQMFIVKKCSSAALLMEKVGKAPKDRLCRKEVGLSEISLEKFMKVNVELLEIISQSQQDSGELPRFDVEDVWQQVQGPSSLVELALEQKESTIDLVQHHYLLSVIIHAVLIFGMKSVKPLSLFDTKGRNAFFKPLPTIPTIPKTVDEAIHDARLQFLCRVVSAAVQSLGEPEPLTPSQSPSPSTSPTHKLKLPQSSQYMVWPNLVLTIAKDLSVEQDDIRRHLCCELFSSGFDKLGEEVLRSINNHPEIGSQLLVIAGKRLHQFIFVCDPPDALEKLSKCSTAVSTWLKTLDPSQLRYPNPPLSSTATLVGHAVNQLPEGHSEYKLAIELVDLVQHFI